MPSGKRLFHGAAAWRSQKIARLPEWMRPEYAWVYAIANDFGCFEADGGIVWSTCYSFSRRNISQQQVAEMLDAFHEVGLLFRWRDEQGRECGFWTGSEKSGRLPAPSERSKADREFPQPPRDQLLEYEGRQRVGSAYGRPTIAVGDQKTQQQSTPISPTYEQPTEGVGIASAGLDRLGMDRRGEVGDINSASHASTSNAPPVEYELLPEEDDEQWTRELAQRHSSLENPEQTYRAIFDAIGSVMRDRKVTKAEAKAYLWSRTERYREITAGYPEEQKKYIKGSHTWFGKGCYNESDETWQRRGKGNANGNGSGSKAEQRLRNNINAASQVVARLEESEAAGVTDGQDGGGLRGRAYVSADRYLPRGTSERARLAARRGF